MSMIKPYPVNTPVKLKRQGAQSKEYKIQSYNYSRVFKDGLLVDKISYKVKSSKDGWVSEVEHDEILPPYDVSDLTIDQMLIEWQNYHDLYKNFGDAEYLNRVTELEVNMSIQSNKNRRA